MSAPRILIVEDVEEMRLFLSEILSASGGFEIVGQAANGWEARLIFDRKRPDWVLLDELLPGESSLDLLKDFSSQGARVILMTGMGTIVSPDQPKEGPKEGSNLARGRVTKPEWDQPRSTGGQLSPEAWLEAVRKLVDAVE